jgi:hypothetical protein
MSKGSYADKINQARRLTLLRLLHETPNYRANLSVLHSAIDDWGFSCSRDQLRTEINWLAEQGLVDVEDLGPTLVVSLSERGADVATGAAIVPGVKRPSPRP